MSPLRRRMIDDMQIRNLTPNTQRVYVEQVVRFARHFRKSPELLGPAEIRTYLIHLTQERRLAASSIIVAVSALRFFFTVTLKRALDRRGRHPRRPSGEEASRRAEPGRGRAFPGRRRQPEAPHDPDHLLRDRSANFRSGPPQARRDRQQAHGHPGRTGQRPQGPLCHATAQAARSAQGLLEAYPSRRLAVSRARARPADLAAHRQSHLPGGAGSCAASTNRLRHMRCATRSPFICWRPAPICAPSSCCSAIAT